MPSGSRRPASPPVKTELTVIEDPAKLKEALPMMIRLYDTLVKMMSNPVTRLFHPNGCRT